MENTLQQLFKEFKKGENTIETRDALYDKIAALVVPQFNGLTFEESKKALRVIKGGIESRCKLLVLPFEKE